MTHLSTTYLNDWYRQQYDGFEPTSRLRRELRRAFRAREWFAVNGPPDAPPLPISYKERERLKRGETGLPRIVALYARSLGRWNYDVERHPSFEDYACGVMASEYTGAAKNNEEMRRRFPPRPLHGLGPGLYWGLRPNGARDTSMLSRQANRTEVANAD